MATPRDSQRQRLYDAEEKACAAIGMPHWGQYIKNAELQTFVDRTVLGNRAVASRWPGKKITVKLTHGGGWAWYGSEIRLGKEARNEFIILHEIAHCLTPDTYAPHGPEFAGILVWLVQTIHSREFADALRQAFKDGKVRKSNAAIPTPMNSQEKALFDRVTRLRAERTALDLVINRASSELRTYREEHPR